MKKLKNIKEKQDSDTTYSTKQGGCCHLSKSSAESSETTNEMNEKNGHTKRKRDQSHHLGQQ